MKPFNINLLVDNQFKLNGTFNHKINVIQGPSGCGKSYFVERAAIENTDIRIINTAAMPIDRIEESYRLSDILVFDEFTTAQLKRLDFLTKINKMGNRCLFITRDPIKAIPYSYKAVYTLEFDSSINEYNYVRKYPDFDTVPEADMYLTEDTNSGYYYFSKYLQNHNSMKR